MASLRKIIFDVFRPKWTKLAQNENFQVLSN